MTRDIRAHQTVRLSRKTEVEILEGLGNIIGDEAIQVIRGLVESSEDDVGHDVERPAGRT